MARLFILDILEVRFGTVPDEVQREVQSVEEMERLQTLYRNSYRCDSLQAFIANLDLAIPRPEGWRRNDR